MFPRSWNFSSIEAEMTGRISFSESSLHCFLFKFPAFQDPGHVGPASARQCEQSCTGVRMWTIAGGTLWKHGHLSLTADLQPRKSSNYSWRTSLNSWLRKTWTIQYGGGPIGKNSHHSEQLTAAREKYYSLDGGSLQNHGYVNLDLWLEGWLQTRKSSNYGCMEGLFKTWPRL